MTEAADFFVAGGTLRPDDPSYVTRPADHDLLQQLRAGEFCYVLTPRQMGKSSLMVRTAQRLREDGTRVAIVDLTSIGTGSSELSPDQWYLGLLSRIRTQLRLATDVQVWWNEHGTLGIAQRFTTFLHDVLLAECSEPVVILIDEIDSTLNLGFRDDFFAAIRAVYNERATDPIYQRLTFALFGVATPTDLIQDRERTPFNIGRRIDLREFTLDDAQPLRDGLVASVSEHADTILQRIFYWTSGHPYLTQKLCQTLQAEAGANIETDIADEVDAIVQRTFFSDEGRKDPNLTFVQDRIANSTDSEKRRMLQLYRRVQGGDKVVDDDRSSVQNRLELYGLVVVAQGWLQVRNRIYARVFDGAWVGSMMPVDRRQRRAVLAGVGALVLAVGVLLFIWLQPATECSVYQENFRNFEDSNVRLSALADLINQDCESVAQELFYELSREQQEILFLKLDNFPNEQNRLVTVIDWIYRTLDTDPEHDMILMNEWDMTLEWSELGTANSLRYSIKYWKEGRDYASKERYLAAVQSYKDALNVISNRNHPALHYDLALAYVELEDYENALNELNNLVRITDMMPPTSTPTSSPVPLLTISPTPVSPSIIATRIQFGSTSVVDTAGEAIFSEVSTTVTLSRGVDQATAQSSVISNKAESDTSQKPTSATLQTAYLQRFATTENIKRTVRKLIQENPMLFTRLQDNLQDYPRLSNLGIDLMVQTPSLPRFGQTTLKIIVERVEALDCFDEALWDGCESAADFKAVITIAGEIFETYIISDKDSITPTDWTFAKQIAEDKMNALIIPVKVEIWDNDIGFSSELDDKADLNPGFDDSLNLAINLNDCIEGKPGAVRGNFDITKNCDEPITSQGTIANPAFIQFRIIAETSKDTLLVKNEAGKPIANAEIRHFRSDEQRNIFLTDSSGKAVIPCLRAGDELMAAQEMYTQPITDTSHQGWHYRTYLTSLTYHAETSDAFPYVVGNEQCGIKPFELTIKQNSPLVLFNLVVSTSWKADTNFLNQLRRSLIAANAVIVDVTDGQFAFGNISIHTDREHWDEADIQITSSNYRRPYTITGGITRQLPYTYRSSVGNQTTFYPGYIRIGRSWDRYGSPNASLDNFDGFRMIAHEFASYAFMLFNEFFYFDDENNLLPTTCPSLLMFNPYVDNAESALKGNLLWNDACRSTEQYLTHGESAWETLATVYADYSLPHRWSFRLPLTSSNAGPVELPFELTSILLSEGGSSNLVNGTGLVKLTVHSVAEALSYTGQTQLFTLRKDERNLLQIFEQGTIDQNGVIELVNMKPSDFVIAASWDGLTVGTKRYDAGNSMQLEITDTAWRPFITVNPIQNTNGQVTGITIEATLDTSVEGNLMAALIPNFGVVSITDTITLTPVAPNKYAGIWYFSTDQTLDEAFLWISDVSSGAEHIYENVLKQVVLPVTMRNTPSSSNRSNPHRYPSSNDGYCRLYIPSAEWSAGLPIVMLSPQSLPSLDTLQRLVSTPCYISVPTPVDTFTQPVNLVMYYNREATSGIQQDQLRIYHWDMQLNQWHLIANSQVDTLNSLISARIVEPGLYVVTKVLPSN